MATINMFIILPLFRGSASPPPPQKEVRLRLVYGILDTEVSGVLVSVTVPSGRSVQSLMVARK